MLERLMQFTPCEKLTVADVKCIAATARELAFHEFEPASYDAMSKILYDMTYTLDVHGAIHRGTDLHKKIDEILAKAHGDEK